MFDVNYFIKKFEAIPEDKWTPMQWFDKNTGACCALGHCGVRGGYDISEIEEAQVLTNLIFDNCPAGINSINAGSNWGLNFYPQPTPKRRVLAALYDVREATIKAIKPVNEEVQNKV